MRRWRNRKAVEDSPPAPPPTPPVELPDEKEAEEALAEAKAGRRHVQTVVRREVEEFIESMRAAREENNFAEGIVEMIRHGR
jgi:hypothetical protein